MQLYERPEGPANALQPKQLAQRDPVQDVWEQHVFPGQVQEPADKGALVSVGRCLLASSPPLGSRTGVRKSGLQSQAGLISLPWVSLPSLGPSSARYLTAPGSCSPPDGSIGGSIGCLVRVRNKINSRFGLRAAAANPPLWAVETDRFNRVPSH